MAYDPLARFRRGQQPRKEEPEQVQVQTSDEDRALKAAIDALNEIPNTPLKGAYKNTYALIPVLETVYKNAERELEWQRGVTPMTDAEIDAAVEHDLRVLEESQDKEPEQGLKSEPVYTRMTDAEVEKAA